MATPKKDPAAKLKTGPKKLIPADARNRTIRCTEGEYALLMARLREIRDAQKPANSRAS